MSREDKNAQNTGRVAERLISAAESVQAGDPSKAKREVTMALAFSGHITTHASQEQLRDALREPMQQAEAKGVTASHWQAVATELKSQAGSREGRERTAQVLAALVTYTDSNALYVQEAGAAERSKLAGVAAHIKEDVSGLKAHVIHDVSGLKDQLEERLATLGMQAREGAVAFSVSKVQTPTSALARPASALSHA